MRKEKKVTAIILAAGSGSRMNSALTKQRMTLAGKSVLLRSAEAFERCPDISSIIVVCREDELDFAGKELEGLDKIVSVIAGGESRASSAAKGFSAIPEDTDLVAIHDAARCLITPQKISAVIAKARECGAATAAAPVYDTIKVVDKSGRITSTPRRDTLYRAMTPQVFDVVLYRSALNYSSELANITDDNMLLERMGADVYCVDVGSDNIKITTPEDMLYAELILKERGDYV